MATAMVNSNPVIIDECLCYIVNKFDKVTIMQLKTLLCNFYMEDELIKAKDCLFENASLLNCTGFPARKIKRLPGNVKLIVDDIMEYITLLDEAKLIGDLPIFVAKELARLPTVKIEEMDVYLLARKVETLENRLEVGIYKTLHSSGANEIVEKSDNQPIDVQNKPQSRHRQTPTSNDEVEIGLGYNKKDSYATAVNSLPGDKVIPDNSWKQVVKRKPKKQLVGIASTDSCPIKAGKLPVKKFIFHLDNIAEKLECHHIEDYLKSHNVHVISIFDAKTWMKSSNGEEIYAYRICISLTDKEKVWDTNIWPDGATLREWKFKSKRLPQTNNDHNDG